MSKIPQGEWDAIAARYAQGEAISRIARSYGCTPPAIHYILKRSKQRTTPGIQQPQKPAPQALSSMVHRPVQSPDVPENARSTEWRGEELGTARLPPDEAKSAMVQSIALRPSRDREFSSGQLTTGGRPRAAIPQQALGNPRSGGRSPAFTAGLDRELYGRAEAAIGAFRSSFDAALAEGSPRVHQQLRRAASDLMRVAARTTIVLDRLTANAERTAAGAEGQSPSGRARF
jgi:hypothetical protein